MRGGKKWRSYRREKAAKEEEERRKGNRKGGGSVNEDKVARDTGAGGMGDKEREGKMAYG